MIEPQPFDEVGMEFVISGWIPKSCLAGDRVMLDYIDIDCHTFRGGPDADVIYDKSWLGKFRRKVRFYATVQFSQFNIPFIIKSQGRIAVKLRGGDDDCILYLPLIVKGKNPDFKADPEIIEKHNKIGETIMRYEKDLEEYNAAWQKIQERRKEKSGVTQLEEPFYFYSHDWETARGILDILGQEEGVNKEYPYIQEDEEEERLEEKYKDAIKWRGPLLHGTICKMNGFDYVLYSNDHGRHFHIKHRGRRIDARFSFPEIELINYKNTKNCIGSKEKDKLIEFIKKPENFKRLEGEFLRREGVR